MMKKRLQLKDYINGLQSQNMQTLAKAITLVESVKKTDRDLALQIITHIIHTIFKKELKTVSKVVGITGSPGAGKSTFIENFCLNLAENGNKIAVLSIDPSSQFSGGSIMGDKTRMNRLAVHPHVYIRPSPAGQKLGGLAARSREVLFLCRFFQFDYIFIETVGVGQSEADVKDISDCFMMLVAPGAGDDLQGIKKGILENVDFLLVNKADGEQKVTAQTTLHHYQQSLQILKRDDDYAHVFMVSALEGLGMDDVHSNFSDFFKSFSTFQDSQKYQFECMQWLKSTFEDEFLQLCHSSEKFQTLLNSGVKQLGQNQFIWKQFFDNALSSITTKPQ